MAGLAAVLAAVLAVVLAGAVIAHWLHSSLGYSVDGAALPNCRFV